MSACMMHGGHHCPAGSCPQSSSQPVLLAVCASPALRVTVCAHRSPPQEGRSCRRGELCNRTSVIELSCDTTSQPGQGEQGSGDPGVKRAQNSQGLLPEPCCVHLWASRSQCHQQKPPHARVSLPVQLWVSPAQLDTAALPCCSQQ